MPCHVVVGAIRKGVHVEGAMSGSQTSHGNGEGEISPGSAAEMSTRDGKSGLDIVVLWPVVE